MHYYTHYPKGIKLDHYQNTVTHVVLIHNTQLLFINTFYIIIMLLISRKQTSVSVGYGY